MAEDENEEEVGGAAGAAAAKRDGEHTWDIDPCKQKCAQCGAEVVTFVQHEMNPFYPLFAILCVMIFGFLFLVIGPVTFLIT